MLKWSQTPKCYSVLCSWWKGFRHFDYWSAALPTFCSWMDAVMSRAGCKLSNRAVFHLKNASLTESNYFMGMYLLNWIFWQKSAHFLTGSPVYLISEQNWEPCKPSSSWDTKDFPGRKPGSQGALFEPGQPGLLESQLCGSKPERKAAATLSHLDKAASFKKNSKKGIWTTFFKLNHYNLQLLVAWKTKFCC